MKRSDIEQLLKQLNDGLANINERRELVVCGGAALILSNFKKEETADIDILSPDKDVLLLRLSKEIAKTKTGIRTDWLNSNAASFFKEHNPLPSGWQDRLVETFKSTHLIVKALAPEDILFSKICSHIDREMDEDDIRELAKTKSIFECVVKRVSKLDRFKDTTSKIIIDELRVRLGFNDTNEK